MVMIVARHLRKPQGFIIVPASLTGRFHLGMRIKHAIQDMDASARVQPGVQIAAQFLETGKILNAGRHQNQIETIGTGQCLKVALQPL